LNNNKPDENSKIAEKKQVGVDIFWLFQTTIILEKLNKYNLFYQQQKKREKKN
jgi:hypothetical protein